MNSLVGIDTRWKLLVQVHSPLATHGGVEKVFREYAYENWLLRTSRRAYPSWTEHDWTRAPRLQTTEFSLSSLSFLFNPLSRARLFTEAPTHSRNILSLSLAFNTNEPQSFLTLLQCIFWSLFLRKLRSMYHTWMFYTHYICIYRVFCSFFSFFFFFTKRSWSLLIKSVISSQAYICVYACSCIHINKKDSTYIYYYLIYILLVRIII